MKKCLSLIILLLPVNAIAEEKLSYDKSTGLVIDTGVELVKTHCTACHSAALVIQNRMSRDTWLETIRWMQKTQGLWPLADMEPVILDYLAKNYSPVDTGRRKNLGPHLLPSKL